MNTKKDAANRFPVFSERLKSLRGIKSRKTVANELNITRQSLEYYEKGERLPDALMVMEIAKYFNVSSDYLLGLTDNPTNDKDLASAADYLGISDKSALIIRKITKGDENTGSVLIPSETAFYCTNNRKADIMNWIVDNNMITMVAEIYSMLSNMDNNSFSDTKLWHSVNEKLYIETSRLTDGLKIRLNQLIQYYSINIAKVPVQSIFDLGSNYFYFLEDDNTKKAGD